MIRPCMAARGPQYGSWATFHIGRMGWVNIAQAIRSWVMTTRTYLQGEVDIVEGVNDQEPNLSSLHTSRSACRCHRRRNQKALMDVINSFSDCHMPASRLETG